MLDMIRQFWFALNSANSTKSLSIAIALGVIVGLTPTLSLHNYLIFVVVLLFAVHIGLFLITTSIFSLIGFLLDPLFHSFGKSVLTAESMVGFWTTLYNLPLMKLASFNNTILMGSLIASLVLAPIVYILAQKIFAKYREVVMHRCSNIPVLSIFFYNESKALKKKSIFRMSGVIAVAVVTGVIVFVLTVLVDPIIKYSISKTIEKTTGKKVSIQSLNSSLLSGSFEIEGFKLIDKNEVIASFDTLYIELKPSLLFDKKIIIEDMGLSGFDLNRQTIEVLSAQPQDKEKKDLAQSLQSTLSKGVQSAQDRFQMPTAQEILESANLESVKRVQEIQKDLEILQERYTTFQKDIGSDTVGQLQTEIESFQKELEGLKDPAAILGAKSKFDSLQSNIKEYQKKYGNIYSELNESFERIQRNIAGIDRVVAQDVERLKQTVTTPDGLFSIVGLFTAGNESEYMQKAYNIYLKVKPYLQSDAPKDEKEVYIRDLGEFIIYEDVSPYPRVAILSAKFDGVFEENRLDLVLTNFSTDQTKTQKPMLFIATALNPQFERFEAKLLNDSFSDEEKTQLNLFVSGLQSPQLQSSNIVLEKAKIDIELQSSISVQNDTIDSNALLQLQQVALSSPASRQLSNALAGIKSFDLSVDSFISADKTDLKIDSNAAQKFSSMLATQFSDAQEGLIEDLQKGIYEKLNLSSLQSQQSQVDSILKTLGGEKSVMDNLSKELTKSFTDAQKVDTGRGIEGLMRGLF